MRDTQVVAIIAAIFSAADDVAEELFRVRQAASREYGGEFYRSHMEEYIERAQMYLQEAAK